MDTKTIYILYSYYMGDNNSSAVGWSESEEELKALKAQLKKKPECPYGKNRRQKIDAALAEWEEVELEYIKTCEKLCPYYDKTKVPHVTDMKKYSEWATQLEQDCKVKRAEWFELNHPGLTTQEELVAYDEFLERENDYTGYYIRKLKHV